MAVTFLSNGYDSTTTNPYTEAEWAEAHPSIGLAAYGVRSPADWKVSAVAGQDRTVSIAAGRGWGYGVTDKTVENDTIQLGTIASGSRWDLIVVRRDWNPTAGTSKFEKVAGGPTATVPGGRLVGPGNIDDQPLALVQVTAGQTQPTNIIDLRTWSGDGGGLVANHDLVRSYLNATGTRVTIGGVDWVRQVGANDVPEWVKYFLSDGMITGVEVPVAVSASGIGWIGFPKTFPTALDSCVITDSTNNALLGPVIFKMSNANSDTSKAVFIAYGQNSANRFVPLGVTGMYVNFIAKGR